MRVDMQGGRYDGRPWPGFKGLIDVPEWEAAELIKAQIAEYPTEPELDRGYDVLRVPDPDYESGLKLADGGIIENDPGEHGDSIPAVLDNSTILPDSDNDDFYRDDDDDEAEEVTPQVKRPRAGDSKGDWIEYAVANGADREKASAKTKAMLMADY
jgi:hypothetical protein